MSKTMTKKGSRGKRRCNTKRGRRCAKGGMYRRAVSQTAKNVFGKVFGETGPERLSKGKDMVDAGLKGIADAAKNGGPRTPSAPGKPFAVDSPRYRIERPLAITPPLFDKNYITPKKTQPDETGELLPKRLKPVETESQRAQRLGLRFAPTLEQPVSIVTKLFNENDDIQ